MSQYGIPYDQDEPWVCGALDLSIETLTGTAFEIRVSPTDTIMSIKAKIQRFEGIPVSQQHLLYNLVELENSASVQDYAIQNGATLKLILSMRGGPISTRRLPSAGEAVWRELEEWMNENVKVDSTDRLLSAARMIVLVSREGDQVNLFRIVENEDGTYSPLSDSWAGSTLRNLFTEEDPLESARRLQENSVTMRKMEELMENMKKLSVGKKDKKTNGDEEEEEMCDCDNDFNELDDVACDLRNPGLSSPLPELLVRKPIPLDLQTAAPVRTFPNPSSLESTTLPLRLPCHSSMPSPVNEEASSSNPPLNNARSRQTSDLGAEFTQARRPIPFQRNFLPGLKKARKEAENIIRLQSKSLSVVIDSPYTKRSPLPELRRAQRLEEDFDERKPQNNEEFREKTASRLSTSSFAIVEEANDVSSSASGICSSQSSLMALPSNDDMVVSFSSISRDRMATSVGPSRFRVSHYVVDSGTRPKSTPSQIVQRDKLRKQILSDCLQATKNEERIALDVEAKDAGNETVTMAEDRVLPQPANTGAVPRSSPQNALKALPTPAKKRPRCLACRKRLNITNTHTCRCGGIFCSIHRYSEAHDCHFDYKEEGKSLLRLANPLVTASKLPKI